MSVKGYGGGAGKRTLLRWEFAAVAILVLIVVFSFLDSAARDRNQTLDFAIFYTAGKIVRKGLSHHLYRLSLQREVQHQFGKIFLPFDHAPFEALLFAPLTVFGYPQALLIWDALNVLVLGLVANQLRKSSYRLTPFGQVVWWALCVVLALAVLMLGQDSLLLFPVFLFSFLALKKKREYAAGLWLGAGLFRFEIVLPFAFIFLLRKRWKVTAGFCAASLVLGGVSLAMIGWNGLVDYVKLLLHVSRHTASQASGFRVVTMPSLRGILFTLFGAATPRGLLFPLVVAASLVLLIWTAWQCRNFARPAGTAFDLEFSLATIAALVASYVVFIHELTPLLVVAFLLLGYEGSRPRTGIFGNRIATGLLSLFTLIFAAGWLAFGFHTFSVEALVLFGLLAWLARESSALRKAALSG